MNKEVDNIIIGAGIYGLYAALLLKNKGKKVVVLEYEDSAMLRATYINQARVHNGYHYPRSFSTAMKSVKYFKRFCEDFPFAINNKFDQIYAIAKDYSFTSGEQFSKFAKACDIRCEEILPTKYFQAGFIDGAYLTEEFAFDSNKIKEFLIEKLSASEKVEIIYGVRISSIENTGKTYLVKLQEDKSYEAATLLNATYASTNQITNLAALDGFKIKYEICEMILGNPTSNLNNVGLTVMDGPFFSIMPFGLSSYHSLTSVTFTPHITSHEKLPRFPCQKENVPCTPLSLSNCNTCPNRPKTSWNYMYALMKKYVNTDIDFLYSHSLFSIKPILMESEIDDSRPTVIRELTDTPRFISVLSGKINTIYDLEGVL